MSRLLNKISDDLKLRLGATDLTLVFIHLLVGLTFWAIFNLDRTSGSTLKEWISSYYFLMPFALVGFFFRNLRRLRFYLVWVAIGVIQLLIYHSVKGIPDFQFARGNAFSGLKALLPTLLMFQILRQVFFRLYGQEMNVTMGKGRITIWGDVKNITWIEVGFSVLLMATIVLFSVV